MFYEIIATLIAGFAGAGIVLLLNKLSGGRLPKWAMPVGAGLAMIIVTVANEYAWFARTKSSLPDGFQVVQMIENNSLYRPWTYVVPFVERFIAVDAPSLRTHSVQPALRMADTYVMGRWSAPQKLIVLADCDTGHRAPLIDDVSFAEDGTVSGVDWFAPGEGDPLVTSICGLESAS